MATCRECISFDDCVIKEIKNNNKIVNDCPDFFESKSETVTRKHGKWMDADLSFFCKPQFILCPYCMSDYFDQYGDLKDEFKFCPNCGADMRKEDNNANNIR